MTESNRCNLCQEVFSETLAHPDICHDLFHYKCLRNYIDERLECDEPILCPKCSRYFGRIANKHKNSTEIIYQNCIISADEYQCFICFTKYSSPVAYSDQCRQHAYCYACYKKWCKYKHECPMDRLPVSQLIICDFPGGHVLSHEDPPAIELSNVQEEDEAAVNTICEICRLGNNEAMLLLCDNCNKGYHIYCLPEPLTGIPEGDWYCHICDADEDYRPHDTSFSEEFPHVPRGVGRVIANLELRTFMEQEASRTTRRITTRSRAANQANNTSGNNTMTTRSRRNRILDDEEEESSVHVTFTPLVATRRPTILESDESEHQQEESQQPTSTTPVTSQPNIEEATSTTIDLSSHEQVIPEQSTTSTRPHRKRSRRRKKSKRKKRRRSSYQQESQSSELESNDVTTTEDEYDVEEDDEMEKLSSSSSSTDEEDEETLSRSNRRTSTSSRKRPSRTCSNRNTPRKKPRLFSDDDDDDEVQENNNNSSSSSHNRCTTRKKLFDDEEEYNTSNMDNANRNFMLPSTSSGSSAFNQNMDSPGNSRTKFDHRNRYASSSATSSSSTIDTESTLPMRFAAFAAATKITRQEEEEHLSTRTFFKPPSSASSTDDDDDDKQELQDDDVDDDKQEELQDDDDDDKQELQDDDDDDDKQELRDDDDDDKQEELQDDDDDDWRPESTNNLSKPKTAAVRRSSRRVKRRRMYDVDSPTMTTTVKYVTRNKSAASFATLMPTKYVNQHHSSDQSDYDNKPPIKSGRVPVKQYNIIDSINESQSNLFRMTLNNIDRQHDGTIKMKPAQSSSSHYSLITKPSSSSSSSTAVSTPSKSPSIPPLKISFTRTPLSSTNKSAPYLTNYRSSHHNAQQSASCTTHISPTPNRQPCNQSSTNYKPIHNRNVSSTTVTTLHQHAKLQPSTSSAASPSCNSTRRHQSQHDKSSSSSCHVINEDDMEGSINDIVSRHFDRHVYSNAKYAKVDRRIIDVAKESVQKKIETKFVEKGLSKHKLTKEKLSSFVKRYIDFMLKKEDRRKRK